MNAVEFVKKFGIEHARLSIERVPKDYIDLSSDLKSVAVNGNFRYCMTAIVSMKKTEAYINDLKQIVDAFELVESKGGLRLAHIFMQSDKFKSYSWHGKIHFEKAINLMEQCNA